MGSLYVLAAVIHLYIAARLLPDLPGGALVVAVAAPLLAGSTLLVPLGLTMRRRWRGRWSERTAWAGLVAIGLFSSLLVLTLARDLALVVAFAASRWLDAGSYAEFAMASAAAVPISAVAVTALGFLNARRRARVRDVNVPIRDLPEVLHGFSIVQISDVHVGPTIRRPFVDAIVDAVNALNADMIAVTGDLVDDSVRQLATHTAPLARLSARHGAYFVTGNHEYYSGVDAWVAELRRLGLVVLLNQHVVLDHDGASVVVAGVVISTASTRATRPSQSRARLPMPASRCCSPISRERLSPPSRPGSTFNCPDTRTAVNSFRGIGSSAYGNRLQPASTGSAIFGSTRVAEPATGDPRNDSAHRPRSRAFVWCLPDRNRVHGSMHSST